MASNRKEEEEEETLFVWICPSLSPERLDYLIHILYVGIHPSYNIQTTKSGAIQMAPKTQIHDFIETVLINFQ
jgi:hypothetical protein